MPIRLRLTAIYGITFFVLTALLGVATYVSVRMAVDAQADQEIDARLAGLEDHLARHVGRMAWPALRDSLQAHPAFQPALLRIAEPDGTLRFEGQGIRDAFDAQAVTVPRRATVAHDGRRLRVRQARSLIAGAPYDLALGADLSSSGAVLDRLWLALLVGAPAAMLLASFAGYWISGAALAPVRDIIAAARAIDSSRLADRVAVPATGDEIAQLAVTTNGMLDRIEHGVRQVHQFTADASHELRTPVAVIRAASEVALLNPFGGDRPDRDALRRIQREAERASTLLESLLILAREDARGSSPSGQTVRVDLGIKDACASLEPIAVAKGVAIIGEEITPLLISGEPEALRRLWTVLIDNAVKYTPAGGTVRVSAVQHAEGAVRVSVVDTGVGIDPQHLPNIFDRFYRADVARSRAEGGVGLGLAIAKGIADRHGARIDVSSTPGRGSTFSVTIPASRCAGVARAS